MRDRLTTEGRHDRQRLRHPSARTVARWVRRWLLYRHRSEHHLRRLVEHALRDPIADALLEVRLVPPIDHALGEAVKDAFKGLREAVVIPSLEGFWMRERCLVTSGG